MVKLNCTVVSILPCVYVSVFTLELITFLAPAFRQEKTGEPIVAFLLKEVKGRNKMSLILHLNLKENAESRLH